VIFQAIADKLKQRDPEVIFGLSQMFDEISYPAPSYQHCVLCHKNFDPRVADRKACKVKHTIHEPK
jgi:hypothetical protein